MYLVIYGEGFGFYCVDNFTVCFTEYEKAKIYVKRLNRELANKYNVRIEDLEHKYIVEEIKKGE